MWQTKHYDAPEGDGLWRLKGAEAAPAHRSIIIRGFSEHQERVIRAALARIPVDLGELVVQLGQVPDGAAGYVTEDGRVVLNPPAGLSDGALGYLVAHEVAHQVEGHVELYQLLQRGLPVADRQVVKDACEAQADQQVLAWGFAAEQAAWFRQFPMDERARPGWAEQVRRRWAAAKPRITREIQRRKG